MTRLSMYITFKKIPRLVEVKVQIKIKNDVYYSPQTNLFQLDMLSRS